MKEVAFIFNITGTLSCLFRLYTINHDRYLWLAILLMNIIGAGFWLYLMRNEKK